MGRRRRDDNPISLFSFQDIVTSVTGILILLSLILAISVITQGAESVSITEFVPAGDLKQAKETLEQQIEELDRQLVANEQVIVGWIGASIEELARQRSNYEAMVKELQREIDKVSGDVNAKTKDLTAAKADTSSEQASKQIEQTAEKLDAVTQELNELKSGSRVFYNFRAGARKAWLVQLSKGQILAARAGENSKPKAMRNGRELIAFAKGLPDSERYLVLVVRPSGVELLGEVREELENTDIDLGVELIGESQVVVDPEKGAGGK